MFDSSFPPALQFGTSPTIILSQHYFKAAALHEFLHYWISRDYLRDGAKHGEEEPRYKALRNIFEKLSAMYENFHALSESQKIDIELDVANGKINSKKIHYDEEMAINEFLLRHRDLIGLSSQDIDQLLTRYIGDVSEAEKEFPKAEIEQFDDQGLKRDQKSKIVLYKADIQRFVEHYKSGSREFLESQPELAKRAKDLKLDI